MNSKFDFPGIIHDIRNVLTDCKLNNGKQLKKKIEGACFGTICD